MLKMQMCEKAALRKNETEKKKRTNYLASLPMDTQKKPTLADCDGCHKIYPRTRLTSKKALHL